MTEMSRTSVTTPSGVPARDRATAPAAASSLAPCCDPPRPVPHSPQNFAPGGLTAPHVGQPLASRDPHSRQNLRVGSFGVPHWLQVSTVAG